MEIIKYKNTDRRYAQTLQLRDVILRQPFGLSIYDEDLSYESENFFFGMVENDELLGTVNYFVKSDNVAQVCAFAVRADKQKQGIGSQLIIALLTELQARNFKKCIVSARPEAVKFYEKFGFIVDAPVKTKQGGMSMMMELNF